MHRIYKTPSVLTVPNIARDVYDVIDVDGVESAVKLEWVAGLLRKANLTIPEDDIATVASGTWVAIPKHRRVPFRIAAWPDALRTKLANMTPPIRNIEQAVMLRPSVIIQLDPTITKTEAIRLLTLCALVGLPGVGPAAAQALYDSSIAIRSRDELREATNADLRTALNNANAGPVAWRDQLPWSFIRNAARSSGRRKVRVQPGHLPVSSQALRPLASSWQSRALKTTSSVEEQRSANIIAGVRRIQASLAEAYEAAQRNSVEAPVLYAKAYGAIADAVAEAGVALTSSERAGPSLNSLLIYTRKALNAITEEHLAESRTEMGIAPYSSDRMLRSFTLADLQTAKAEAVFTTRILDSIARGGGAYERAWSLALANTKTVALPTNLKDGISAVDGAPVRSMSVANAGVFNENLRAHDANSLRTALVAEEELTRGSLDLSTLKDQFLASAEPPTSWTVAAAVQSTGTSKLPPPAADPDFHNGFTVFDRYVALQKGEPTQVAWLPLTSEFEALYKDRVIAKHAASGKGDVINLTKEDAADPSAFLMSLPLFYTASLPKAQAKALRDIHGNEPAATAYELTAFQLEDLASGSGYFNKSAYERLLDSLNNSGAPIDIETLVPTVASWNAEGDRLYRLSDYEGARQYYQDVVREAEKQPYLLGTTVNADTVFSQAAIVDDANNPTEWEPFVHVRSSAPKTLQYTKATAAWAEGLGVVPHTVAIPMYPSSGSGFRSGADLTTDGNGEVNWWDDDDIIDRIPPWERLIPFPPGGGGTKGGGGTDGPGTSSPIPAGDVDLEGFRASYAYALARIRQLDAGLNWLGLDPQMVPVWSFEVLITQARYFCSRTDELQQRSMSLALTARNHRLDELQAELAVDLAMKTIAVAEATVEVAQAQLREAEKQREVVEKRFTVGKAVATVSVAAVAASTAAVLASSVVLTGGAAAPVLAVAAATPGAVGVTAGAAALPIVASGSLAAYYEGRQHKREVAVADASVEVADAQISVAAAQLDVAHLQYSHAATLTQALLTSEVNSEAISELLAFVETLSASYMDMAHHMAWLAERSYAWETRQDLSRILMSYRDDDSLQSRFGMAAALLQHLDTLEFDKAAGASSRVQQVSYTMSLLRHHPTALATLRESGAAAFGLTQQDLDLLFPGLFLHRLRRVEVEFDGIVPVEGVNAILSAVGQSYVRVPNTPGHVGLTPPEVLQNDWLYPEGSFSIVQSPFVLKPYVAPGATQTLSSYSRRNDSVLLAPAPGSLDAFENLSPTSPWLLRLPSTANNFDLNAIADVRIRLFFEGTYSPDLDKRQLEVLSEAGSAATSQGALFVASQKSPLELATLREAPRYGMPDHRLLTLRVASADLLARLVERTVSNVHISIPHLQERQAVLKLRIGHTLAPFGTTVLTATDSNLSHDEAIWGEVYSGIGLSELVADPSIRYLGTRDGHPNPTSTSIQTIFSSRASDYPTLVALVNSLRGVTGEESALGSWFIKVLEAQTPTGAIMEPMLDDDGNNLLLNSGRLLLPDTGTATFNGMPKYAHAVCYVSGQLGTVSVSVNGVSGSLTFSGTSVSVTLKKGTSNTQTVSGLSSGIDAVYRLEVLVLRAEAHLALDGIIVASLDSFTVTADTLVLSNSGANCYVYHVAVTRLRYDGTPLETILEDAMVDDSNWTPGGGMSHVAHAYSPMDLSFVPDVYFQLDYEGVVRSDASA